MVRFTAGRGIALAAALISLALGMERAVAADKVKVAVVSSLGSAPIYVADAKGYFKDEGLDVELVHFDSAQPVAVAVAAGDIDFGSSGLTGAFFTLADNGVLKLIGAGTWERKGFQGLGLIASNQAWDSGVKAIAALKGHSVAITQTGTALHYNLYLMLEEIRCRSKRRARAAAAIQSQCRLGGHGWTGRWRDAQLR